MINEAMEMPIRARATTQRPKMPFLRSKQKQHLVRQTISNLTGEDAEIDAFDFKSILKIWFSK